MTQIFSTEGIALPVTIIKVDPCLVTEIKECKKHGYNAIQIGYLKTKAKSLKKSQLEFFKTKQLPFYNYLREFQTAEPDKYFVGQKLSIDLFEIGQRINITGKSIGKGFSGNQKRHKFKRGPMSHGSKNHRAPGSIGPGTTPGRVFPGKRMAGQLGAKQVTISKLEIIGKDLSQNLLIVKGNVPGKPGNMLRIRLWNSNIKEI